MKGLLYKEFMLDLPTIAVYIVLQLILTAVTTVIAVLGSGSAADISELSNISLILSFTMYFLFSLMPMTTFSCDATHAWQNFSASSPTGPAGQVASKYLIQLAAYASAFILHTAQFIAFSLITGADFYIMIILDLVMVSAFVILSSLEFPFFFAFSFEKGQSVKSAAIAVIAFLAEVYIFFGDLSIFDSPDPLAYLLMHMTGSAAIIVPSVIVLISLPLFCLSMTLSVKLYPMGTANLEQ